MFEGGRESKVSLAGVGSAGVEAGVSVAWVRVAVAVMRRGAEAVLESFMLGGGLGCVFVSWMIARKDASQACCCMVLSVMTAFVEPTGKGLEHLHRLGDCFGRVRRFANGDDRACVSTATLQPDSCRSNAESKQTIDV